MRTLSHTRPRLIALAAAAILAANILLVAPGAVAQTTIWRVPSQVPTLQEAVNGANAGDLILVEPGVYPGGVTVPGDKTGLTIRGLDRNAVILDGEHQRDIGIKSLADGVALENMTARNFVAHGFYWTGVTGYTGRYLTAYNNRLYGIYAFDSVQGLFTKSYASGSGDAAFYIGQCRPCDAEISEVIAEHSALGYSGTNAGGNLVIRDSVWRHNAAGIVPNSLDSQEDPPQRGGTQIVNNDISNNGNPQTPGGGIAGAIIGHGVGIAGGEDNVIENNRISRNTKYGVVLFPIPAGENVYPPNNNTVRANTFAANGMADIAMSAGSGTGNCFADNTYATSAPADIEATWPCGGGDLSDVPLVGDPVVGATLAADYAKAEGGLNNRPSHADMPVPPPQPTMPDPDPEAS